MSRNFCLSTLILLSILTTWISAQSPSSDLFSTCGNLFTCGETTGISYPFWGGNRTVACGYPELELKCNNNSAKIVLSNVSYLFLGIDPDTRVMKLVREDYSSGSICSPVLTNSTFDPTVFGATNGYINFTVIYGCPTIPTQTRSNQFSCNISGIPNADGYMLPGEIGPGTCFASVFFPVPQSVETDFNTSQSNLSSKLQQGFEVGLNVDFTTCARCNQSKGVCGYDQITNQTTCYCSDGSTTATGTCGPLGQTNLKDPSYLNCSSTIQCGSLLNVGYPFWGMNRASYCGVSQFKLTCQYSTTALISISGFDYRVLQVDNASRTMTVARLDYWNNLCPSSFHNTSLDISAPFSYTSDVVASNLTLYYGCGEGELPASLLMSIQFNCSINNTTVKAYYVTTKVSNTSSYANTNLTSTMQYFKACNTSVVLAANQSAVQAIESNPTKQTLQNAVNQGFGLQWDYTIDTTCESCVASGGQCGTDASSGNFSCYCVDKAYSSTCPGDQISNVRGLVISRSVLLLGGSAVVGILLCVWISRCVRGKCWPRRRKNGHRDDVDAMIRSQGSVFPRRYKYRHLKKLTCSFSEKLGEGGYGKVYKGKLRDGGRLVAVKILKNSKGDGEEFINEVASISRTAHVNIVELLGFCYEGKKRALLYDYMPNGSLDKFLPKSMDQGSPNCPLEWKVLHRIAVGIARGLEYLHQGCNTRILHFDIKPQNILLDHDFTPKISDFGLAKLCQGRESIVSMLGMRGTIGYIAPEVFSRTFGAVSHKSDVYSYGMLVSEVIGCKDRTGLEASRSSEMYFPDWMSKHLELGKSLWMSEINSPEDEEIARKMMLVSLWCIQTHPSDRPSMSKVIEMMEGSIELLRVPPRPRLSSPLGPASYGGTTVMSSSVQSSSSALWIATH